MALLKKGVVMDKFLWFLIGTIAGWAIIWLIFTFGAAALTVIVGIFMVAFPVFAVIGLIFVLWALFRKKK